MTQTVTQTGSYTSNIESIKKLKFAENTEFRTTLNRRIDDFFQTTGRQKRDCPQMYFKTAILVLGLITIYVSLVFLAQEWWQALSLSILLGLFMDGIGFNLQHDGSHNAYSNIPWVNKLMAMSMDVIGFSSYYWKMGHTVLHHKYVNLTGYDQDFEFGTFARKTPFQKWFPHHRWQHYYIWLLYGVYAIEWSLIRDVNNLLSNKIDHLDYPRPKGMDLVIFWLGK
jgi:linoleoyl-CoA desaturase